MAEKINADVIIRTIVLILALINSFLTAIGKNPLPFSDDQIYSAVSTIVTMVASIWAWWKNNSITEAAKKADEMLKEEKLKKKYKKEKK